MKQDTKQPLFKYIEVKVYENGNVIKRMDVSDKSDRTIASIDNGININLNHDKYYTFSFESETQLPII